MKNTYLSAEIEKTFPGSANALSDLFIETNSDPSLLDSTASMGIIIPAYMAWCARNGDRPSELVHDYTLRLLAEFGRSKSPEIAHLNFKFTCSPAQRQIIAKFLRWCLDPALLLDTKQIERSLKHWVTG